MENLYVEYIKENVRMGGVGNLAKVAFLLAAAVGVLSANAASAELLGTLTISTNSQGVWTLDGADFSDFAAAPVLYEPYGAQKENQYLTVYADADWNVTQIAFSTIAPAQFRQLMMWNGEYGYLTDGLEVGSYNYSYLYADGVLDLSEWGAGTADGSNALEVNLFTLDSFAFTHVYDGVSFTVEFWGEVSSAATPEPATMLIFGLAVSGAALVRVARRRK